MKDKTISIEEKYDQIVGATFTNLFSFSNEDNVIVLSKFIHNSKTCLYAYEVAKMVSSIYNRKILLDMPLWKYLLFKMKKENRKINIGYNFKHIKQTDTLEMLEYVANAFNEPIGVFPDIYEMYYNRKESNNEN